MDAEAGDLVVLPFTYTDLSSSKQRPALVLSPAWYNQENEDALFAYVTSVPQDPEDRFAVHVTSQEIASGSPVTV